MLVAIALGSNLPSPFGDPSATVREAMRRLVEVGEVRATSSLYTTAPVGFVDQPAFINAAALVETGLSPLDVLRTLLAIEQSFGRDRTNTPPKGPRTLDLDLLLYGDLILNDPALTLPHPAMHERRFVLEPLAEIAPNLIHASSGRTIVELVESL
jgi:2-amino-4-hydroxy-6-hydroxymethyldihydropteridine diphosphokinase